MLIKVVPVFLIVLSISCETVDYCDENLCPLNRAHIGCESSWEFDNSCPIDRKLEELKQTDIELILREHNALRNKVASGKQKGFRPAKRMASMIWNEELAKLAELNVKQCKIIHDQCRNTDQFKNVGQNLGFRANVGTFEDVHTFIKKSIHSWYSEVSDAAQKDIDKCCNSASGETISHFTQIITDRATQIGCGIVRLTNGQFKSSLIACNYALSNIEGEKVYESGYSAAECQTGKNSDFPGLCSEDEPIDPNDL